MNTFTEIDQQVENFFMTNGAINDYCKSKEAMRAASNPIKKKVYKNMNSLLEECYFVGSLKFGNNFIA